MIGRRIAVARREEGLTQRQLARALDVRLDQIDRLESGAIEPGPYLPKIADRTDRPVDWFTSSSTATTWTSSITGDVAGDTLGHTVVLGSVALLVTIRFLTEVVPVLPRAANFIDIPLFVVLAAAAMVLPQPPLFRRRHYLYLGTPAVAFLGLTIVSAVVNSSRVEPAPALVFIYGFLAPIAVYAAVYSLWPAGNARAFSRLLVALGILQLGVVGLIDLPLFLSSGNPDVVSGTFGTNAYQLVFFLLIFTTLLTGIFAVEPGRVVTRAVPFLIVASFATIFLAQYRALLATTVVATIVIGILLGRRARGVVIGAVAGLAFFLAFSYIASNYPFLKLGSTAAGLTENPRFYVTERFKAARTIPSLYQDKPSAVVLGTGPGTFSSRAWQTFARAGSTSRSNVAGAYVSRLVGGRAYETDVSQTYIQPLLRSGTVVQGSRAVASPYSSYLSLLAEVGVGGFVLMVSLYLAGFIRVSTMALVALRHPSRDDPIPALLLATTVAFLTLLQLGFLENWFEVTRVTFLAWMMLAVVTKEVDSRSMQA